VGKRKMMRLRIIVNGLSLEYQNLETLIDDAQTNQESFARTKAPT
jgi:hypothetical protein